MEKNSDCSEIGVEFLDLVKGAVMEKAFVTEKDFEMETDSVTMRGFGMEKGIVMEQTLEMETDLERDGEEMEKGSVRNLTDLSKVMTKGKAIQWKFHLGERNVATDHSLRNFQIRKVSHS